MLAAAAAAAADARRSHLLPSPRRRHPPPHFLAPFHRLRRKAAVLTAASPRRSAEVCPDLVLTGCWLCFHLSSHWFFRQNRCPRDSTPFRMMSCGPEKFMW